MNLKSNIRVYLLLAITALFYGCVSERDDRGWLMYSGDATGSKFSPLTQINTDNVAGLELKWKWKTGDMRTKPRTTIECNPIIYENVMYATTPGLKLAAVEASTGSELWRFDPYEGQPSSGVNRGITLYLSTNGNRIFYVAGSFLYCIDTETGLLTKSFGDEGKVDLYVGLGRDVRSLWVTAATPGILYNDLLILGSTLGEGPSAVAPGHIRAFNVQTGTQEWIFHTIPHPGEEGYNTWPPDAWERVGGANAWGGFTLDENRGWVFCGTGSAAYDHWGGDRLGQNLYANCILALDAATGEKIWHYQVVHHDIWDYDIPCPPNLIQVNGVDAIAQPTKMGHLFILDRERGMPLFPVQELTTPPSQIPGEETWPTQPFPPSSLRYAQQRLTLDEITDLNPAATEAVHARLQNMDLGDIFLPPSIRGAVTLPQFNGGTDWGGAAYNPQTGILFVNASNEAEWISMVKAETTSTLSKFEFGQQLYRAVCSACHGYSEAKNPGAPSLTGLRQIAKEGPDRIHQALLNGKGMMPRFATLSDDERHALVAFVQEMGQDEMLDYDQLDQSFATQIPYTATGHNTFKDPQGYPVNKRPWGTLNAIDVSKGERLWEVALGTYPELEAQGESPTGTFNMGGPAATAGGLIFIGASMDERFRAFDQTSGAVLWEYQLDAGAYSTPAVFSVDGKQYVVVAAGGGGKPGTSAGDHYYCFSLPD